MVWIVALVAIVIIICLVSNFNVKFKEKQKQNEHLEEQIYQLKQEKSKINYKLEEINDELAYKIHVISTLQEKNENLVEEVGRLQVSGAKEDGLNAQIDLLMREIERRNLELERINNELVLSSTNAAALEADKQEKIRMRAELEDSMRDLERRILSGEKVLEEIQVQIKTTSDQLNDLANLKSSVLAVEEGTGKGWTLNTPGDKKRLVELIHQLVDEYGDKFPLLRKELLKIEWSTIWLPQLQQLCVREGLDRGGIYKLTDRENPNVVYIGQAQSIKDRWYTHCKKMLGVEAKGTERLYEYGPDELTWEVVEFKEGNLDSDERYWIGYFKCREIGLNKKG